MIAASSVTLEHFPPVMPRFHEFILFVTTRLCGTCVITQKKVHSKRNALVFAQQSNKVGLINGRYCVRHCLF